MIPTTRGHVSSLLGRTTPDAPRAAVPPQPTLIDCDRSSSDVEEVQANELDIVRWENTFVSPDAAGLRNVAGASSDDEPAPSPALPGEAQGVMLQPRMDAPLPEHVPPVVVPWDSLFPPTKSEHRRYIVRTVLPELVPYLTDPGCRSKSPRELANLAVDKVDHMGNRQWGSYQLYTVQQEENCCGRSATPIF